MPPTKQKTADCAVLKPKKKNSLLRVFVIFFHPSSSVTALGGAEKRLIENLKIFCPKDDLEIAVLESSPSLLEDLNCKKYSLPSDFRGKEWLSTYLEWILWIAKASFKNLSLAHAAKPDVVLVPNNTLPNLISGYLASRIFHKPMCCIVHHIDNPVSKTRAKEHSLYNSYRKIKYTKPVSLVKTVAFYVTLPLLKKANAIITVSNFTARALRSNGVSKVKIFVSGNAVNLELINKTEPYADSKIFDGVFVGRIAKEKGIFDLIKSWRNVVKVKKDAKLLIIGSGLELPALRERVAAYSLKDNVSLHGQCSDRELYSLMKSSKIFIFPSLFEGWGIAVAEALACGLPVVAYDIPALKEIFGLCESVFLVPIGAVDQVTETVLQVLSSENGKLDEISRDYAKRFEWNKIAATDLEAFKEASFKN